MPAFLIFVGVVLLVVALRNTQGSLGQALQTDIPGYATWALALGGVGALGFVPGLRVPARWLLALVLTVLVLKNYQAVLTGFSGITSTSATTAATDPATAYASNPTAAIPAADVSGTGTTSGTATTATTGTAVASAASATSTAVAQATSPLDPNYYTQMFDATSLGFGSVG